MDRVVLKGADDMTSTWHRWGGQNKTSLAFIDQIVSCNET